MNFGNLVKNIFKNKVLIISILFLFVLMLILMKRYNSVKDTNIDTNRINILSNQIKSLDNMDKKDNTKKKKNNCQKRGNHYQLFNKQSKGINANDGSFFQYNAYSAYTPFSSYEAIENYVPHINRLIMQKIKEAEANEPNYDCQSYINRYPDLKKKFGKSCKNLQTRMRAIGHWIQYGKKEKRNPTPIDKLTDVQKEQLLRKQNEQLQIKLLSEIAKLQSQHEKEHKNKKEDDDRYQEKKNLCRRRMSKAASSLQVLESNLINAARQARRTNYRCRHGKTTSQNPTTTATTATANVEKKDYNKTKPETLKDTTITVGNSRTNSKTIQIPMGIKSVDTNYINRWGRRQCNGPYSCGVSDRFRVQIYSINGKKYLKTTRLDSGGGWGMQVKFKAKTT